MKDSLFEGQGLRVQEAILSYQITVTVQFERKSGLERFFSGFCILDVKVFTNGIFDRFVCVLNNVCEVYVVGPVQHD